jgi:hypothetical protein
VAVRAIDFAQDICPKHFLLARTFLLGLLFSSAFLSYEDISPQPFLV